MNPLPRPSPALRPRRLPSTPDYLRLPRRHSLALQTRLGPRYRALVRRVSQASRAYLQQAAVVARPKPVRYPATDVVLRLRELPERQLHKGLARRSSTMAPGRLGFRDPVGARNSRPPRRKKEKKYTLSLGRWTATLQRSSYYAEKDPVRVSRARRPRAVAGARKKIARVFKRRRRKKCRCSVCRS